MVDEADFKQLQNENEELKKQLETLQKNKGNDSDTFKDLKKKYEEVIETKNKELEDLKSTNESLQKKMDSTINDLDDEVQDKLRKAEELAELQKTVEELMVDKAEATVDGFIQKGIILPAQRKTAVKLCLSDNDTFLELYKDAKPIINLDEKPQSQRVNENIMTGLKDYFSN